MHGVAIYFELAIAVILTAYVLIVRLRLSSSNEMQQSMLACTHSLWWAVLMALAISIAFADGSYIRAAVYLALAFFFAGIGVRAENEIRFLKESDERSERDRLVWKRRMDAVS